MTMTTASESIRKHKERILQLWFDEASRAASARGLEEPEFTNLMPTYVSALVDDRTDFGAFSMGPLGAQEQRGRELAQRIVRNVDRTDQMVRDLLDANRIHAGERLPLRLAECDLSALAHETIHELAAVEGERFVFVGEERIVGCWSVDELRRALWNLAMNAVKYGAAERPITISVRATSEFAELAVHNEGAAIPPDEQEGLFRAFARGRALRVGGTRGWGLGLTLVRGCAESHGGHVAVQSNPESGTTFTVELPLDARPFQPRSDASNGQASRAP